MFSLVIYSINKGFPGGVSGKEPAGWYRRCKRLRFNPWAGKIPWRRAWKPMDRGAWKATVNKAAKSPTRLKQFSMLTIHSINSVFASVPISQFLPPPLLSSPGAFMLNISDPSTVWVTGCVLTITVFLFLLNGNPSQSPLRSCWRKTWSY